MTAPDGMIAVIARINGGRLGTRNLVDFATTGLELICPWNFSLAPATIIAELKVTECLRDKQSSVPDRSRGGSRCGEPCTFK